MARRSQVALTPEQRIYLGALLLLVAVLGYFSWPLGLAGAGLLLVLYVYSREGAQRRRSSLEEHLRFLAMQVETTVPEMVHYFPWGVAVLDEDGIVRWCNPALVDMLVDFDPIIGEKLEDLVDGFQTADVDRSGRRYQVGEKFFDVYLHPAQSGNYTLVFFSDSTREEELVRRHREEAPVVGYLQIDNHAEVLASVEAEKRPLLEAAIDRMILEWAAERESFIQQYDEDRYVVIMQQRSLLVSTADKFPLLDRIKTLDLGNRLSVTVSAGFGSGFASLPELGEAARAALDLALGRGGDQVVVKDQERFYYYGGTSRALEKRTKVKARVVAQALVKLLEDTSRVFVMGHQNPDMDSIGAAASMARAIRGMGKRAYVVVDEVGPAVDKLVRYLQEDPEYQSIIIGEKESLRLATQDSLLLVVDTHKPSLVAAPQLLERLLRVVVVDHHRRGEEFISDPVLVYLETYASSSSELVTELLQYMGSEVEPGPREATALLAGIAVDTKNFSYEVGVRTFEAAAYLRRAGADMKAIQELLQDDWDTFLERADIIRHASTLHGQVAVAQIDQRHSRGQLLAAQTANELLAVEGIAASFVLAPINGGVTISARSRGEVNVQIIMEQLGGGGHMTIAGAQLAEATVEEARERLEQLIHQYFAKEEGA